MGLNVHLLNLKKTYNERNNMNFGNKVIIIMCNGLKRCYRNVTEIHYNYTTIHNIRSIAFESDIHGTGLNMFIHDIKEFETELETEKQNNFDEY